MRHSKGTCNYIGPPGIRSDEDCPVCIGSAAPGVDDALAQVREGHKLISAHRCHCGWEGDDAITHIIDILRLRFWKFWCPTNGELTYVPACNEAQHKAVFVLEGGREFVQSITDAEASESGGSDV